MLLIAAAINEIGEHWVAGIFALFHSIQAGKVTFNLTLFEIVHGVYILFQLSCAQCYT